MKSFLMKRFGLKLQILFLLLTGVLTAFGASGDVDTGFNPQLTIDVTSNYYGKVVVQLDGKLIVFGAYGSAGKSFFRRLNADGSLDAGFRCAKCVTGIPTNVAFQSDGKILVIVSAGTGNPYNRLVRVNQDGSSDNSFNAPYDSVNYPAAYQDFIVQPDNKILILYYYALPNTTQQLYISRLESNGTVDPTFTPINPQAAISDLVIAKMILLPDGKILAGSRYGTANGFLNRYSANGTLDNSFQVTVNSRVSGIELLSDGKILITGIFSTVNGTSRSKIARLFPDGTLDTSFSINFANNENIIYAKAVSNGQFYLRIETNYFPVPTPSTYRVVRYNTDGSVDNTFTPSFPDLGLLALDSLNRILTFNNRYYRLNTDGSTDTSFNPLITADGYVSTAALQTDGKVIIAGEFGKANGINHVRISRLNPDSTTDTTFNPGSGFDVPPDVLAVQPDGKILASGRFTTYNGTPRSNILRLNADGSLDTAFSPTITGSTQQIFIKAIAPLASGKILIGGDFTTVNGTTQAKLARLNADGSLDTAFNPVFLNSASVSVYTIYIQQDGKFLVGGSFNIVNGNERRGLARFNADGSLDDSFMTNSDSTVNQIVQRPDGKYLALTANAILLFNNNGSRDYNFSGAGGFPINSFVRQPSGNLVFGGAAIDRTGPNGEADIYFPTYGADNTVNKLLLQPDGKIIFAGNFTAIENVTRSGIARLTLSNRIRGTIFDFDGDARADISVFRPSTNVWYNLFSSNGSVGIQNFGVSGDISAPADYDGDGKTDLGVFRPSIGDWLYLASSNNTVGQYHWGAAGDIPRPADVTGDGKADLVAYRPSTGVWYRSPGVSLPFGIPEDKPLIGDFDGDGKTDMAVFRPSTGDWWYAASSANFQHRAVHWGQNGDIPVPGDYDGDGKTDFVVYRPSDSGWYILYSTGSYTIATFGLAEDKPVAADYDGDGKTDIAVFRPSTGIWYLLQTTAGFGAVQWGISSDVPTENAFIP